MRQMIFWRNFGFFLIILLPVSASLTQTWGWMVEVLLVLSVLLCGHMSALSKVIVVLLLGYIGAILPLRLEAILHIGFTPWVVVLFLYWSQKGWAIQKKMLFCLLTAAFLGAVQIMPVVQQAQDPAMLEYAVEEYFAFYEEIGMLNTLEAQGISSAMLKDYLEAFLPYFFSLLPGSQGVLKMSAFGAAYLIFRRRIVREARLPLESWNLPWYAVWGVILGIACYLLGDAVEQSVLYYGGLNLMLLFGAVAFIIGLACFVYFLKKIVVSKWLCVLLVILLIVFPFMPVITFVFLGLFDLMFNLRKLPEIGKDEGGSGL